MPSRHITTSEGTAPPLSPTAPPLSPTAPPLSPTAPPFTAGAAKRPAGGDRGAAGAAPGQAGLWHTTAKWAVAAAATALLMWLSYTRGGWVPFLSGADLGIHEFGHLLTMWAPPLVCSLAGSVLQVAAPLGMAGYFWWRKDQFATILCTAWAAESLHNVSVYVGDAQAMALPLFGDDGSGAGHDWHTILRDTGLLERTDALANAVFTGSVLLFVVAFGLAALGFVRAQRPRAH